MVTAENFRIRLSIEKQKMLVPGLKAGISSLQEWIDFATGKGISTQDLEKQKRRLEAILDVTEREIQIGRDVTDSISMETLAILKAALELSARIEEKELDTMLTRNPNTPPVMVTQIHHRIAKMREVFSEPGFPGVDVEGKIREWGIQPE